jgi:hypothetical protein
VVAAFGRLRQELSEFWRRPWFLVVSILPFSRIRICRLSSATRGSDRFRAAAPTPPQIELAGQVAL